MGATLKPFPKLQRGFPVKNEKVQWSGNSLGILGILPLGVALAGIREPRRYSQVFPG
jgi:hypothetical protein